MRLEVTGDIWRWVGPAPHYFVTVPPEACEVLREMGKWVSYGWGMIPVRARVGGTTWKTSLFPKEGGYLVPIKASVRRAEGLTEGALVTVSLEVGP